MDDGIAFQRRLRELGVLTTAFGPSRLRMVPHYGITRQDIYEALTRLRQAAASAA